MYAIASFTSKNLATVSSASSIRRFPIQILDRMLTRSNRGLEPAKSLKERDRVLRKTQEMRKRAEHLLSPEILHVVRPCFNPCFPC
jgi:hypothetical protein